MVQIRTINIDPPLINTSCAWASDFGQLKELYDCPFTGAVTTRTATLDGFKEDGTETVVFTKDSLSSLNSYGYSPHPLASYLTWTQTLISSTPAGIAPSKPIIISLVASSPGELMKMIEDVQTLRRTLGSAYKGGTIEKDPSALIAIELNTSCPNIKDHPPPSYDFPSLSPFLDVLSSAFRSDPTLTIGLKLPPYLYSAQFTQVIQVIASYTQQASPGQPQINPFAFLTSTNTLGSSLLFSDQVLTPTAQTEFALPTGFGGLAGEAIHALSLGNVRMISQQLASSPDLSLHSIVLIGAGGVVSKEAVQRMKKAGAAVVGCATILGRVDIKELGALLDSA